MCRLQYFDGNFSIQIQRANYGWKINYEFQYTNYFDTHNWRLVCRSCAIDCIHGLHKLFDAISGVKKQPNFIPAIDCLIFAYEPSDKSTMFFNVYNWWLYATLLLDPSFRGTKFNTIVNGGLYTIPVKAWMLAIIMPLLLRLSLYTWARWEQTFRHAGFLHSINLMIRKYNKLYLFINIILL